MADVSRETEDGIWLKGYKAGQIDGWRNHKYMQKMKENQMVEPDTGTLAPYTPPLGASGPITPIRLRDGMGVIMELRPKSDITTLENAHLMVLLFKLTLSQEMIPPDWQGYIREHGLERHFVTIEPNEDVGLAQPG